MTKSRQSAIKLRLSRLIKCLLALGCLKLAIMGVALFDLPMPAWLGANSVSENAEQTEPVQEFSAPVSQEIMEVARQEPEEMPQGAAAAELAAAAKPRRPGAEGQAALPAPLVPAGPAAPMAGNASLITPVLPEPPALDAPLAAAGVILPEPEQPKQQPEESGLNMLALKALPIPVLGSAQVAHAATIDMPVPQAPGQASPFSPAEQVAPLTGQPPVMPGAPPLPANIPNGQGFDGSPLPMREGGNMASQTGVLPPLPQGSPAFDAPAPNIAPRQAMLDHNAKSQELARQQQDMLMLRQQMDQRLKDLQSAEDKMKDVLREAKDVEDKKVKSLVQMYANMKPRMAAQALENMDERVAVRILSGMAPKQSGEILTYTNPAKTAKFTEMITRLRLGE
ncbi:MAG: hypothetical protein HDQ91_02985 [Desulfovibrio sp.]|nr:hypothetical protein [Desulfovibrio sp.]